MSDFLFTAPEMLDQQSYVFEEVTPFQFKRHLSRSLLTGPMANSSCPTHELQGRGCLNQTIGSHR